MAVSHGSTITKFQPGLVPTSTIPSMGLAEDFQYLANPAAGFEAWRDKQHDNEEYG